MSNYVCIQRQYKPYHSFYREYIAVSIESITQFL